MTNARQELIRQMTREAKEYVEHYFTDFTVFDIPAIVEADIDTEIMYWFLRDAGTHLVDGSISSKELQMYGGFNDRMYELNLKTGICTKVWDRKEDNSTDIPAKV